MRLTMMRKGGFVSGLAVGLLVAVGVAAVAEQADTWFSDPGNTAEVFVREDDPVRACELEVKSPYGYTLGNFGSDNGTR